MLSLKFCGECVTPTSSPAAKSRVIASDRSGSRRAGGSTMCSVLSRSFSCRHPAYQATATTNTSRCRLQVIMEIEPRTWGKIQAPKNAGEPRFETCEGERGRDVRDGNKREIKIPPLCCYLQHPCLHPLMCKRSCPPDTCLG